MPTGIINLFAPKMSSCQYNFSGDYRDAHSLIGQGLHQCIDIVKQMLPTDGFREENPRIEREIYIYVIMYLKLFVFPGSLCLFFCMTVFISENTQNKGNQSKKTM